MSKMYTLLAMLTLAQSAGIVFFLKTMIQREQFSLTLFKGDLVASGCNKDSWDHTLNTLD